MEEVTKHNTRVRPWWRQRGDASGFPGRFTRAAGRFLEQNIGLGHPTWHFTSMSKKTSSPSGCSAFASRRLYREGVCGVSVPWDGAGRKQTLLGPGFTTTPPPKNDPMWQLCSNVPLPCRAWSVLEVGGVQGGLEVLRRKPGKWLMLTRWSSRRRAWELASSSRK